MAPRELHLELLIGRRVVDATGDRVGRIEEVRAKQHGDEWVIDEYLIGIAAILERLSAWTIGLAALKWLGADKIYGGYRVPWDKLDLTDLEHPRLTCTLDELKAISQQLEQQSSQQTSDNSRN